MFRLDDVVPVYEDGHGIDSPRPDDASSDAVPACANPLFIDTFPGPGHCTPWGTSYVDFGAQVQEAGALVITPAPLANSVGGCFTNANLPFGSGITAVVLEAAQGTSVYTVLQIHGIEYQIKASGDGYLRFQTAASQDIGTVVPYLPTMRWWRIRPMPPNTLIGEYSTDGNTWINLGSTTTSLPSEVGIEIAVGTNTTSVSGRGIFDQLVICP